MQPKKAVKFLRTVLVLRSLTDQKFWAAGRTLMLESNLTRSDLRTGKGMILLFHENIE